MLQPEAETGAGASASPAGTNGARHQQGGAGASLGMAAGGSEELGSGGSGGNRWPRQETLALLRIRSDMDAVFRDSNHKGPLWEQVSRKMAELGYRRSDKKCREKFENVYKYHKRTKEGRAGKGDGKTYRFFDQLQSFLPPIESAVPIAMAMPPPRPPPPLITTQPPFTVPSTSPQLIQPTTTPPIHHIPAAAPVHPAPAVQNYNKPISFPGRSPSGSPSSSSSRSSDEEITGMRKSRRKRKWKEFFVKLTKDVMAKQDELQRKFLAAIERRESDRRVRDEAWKAQELARLQREYEILVHERSMASAKDSALISFLQKLSDHQQIPLPPAILQSQPPPPPQANAIPLAVILSISQPQQIPNVDINPVVTRPPPKEHSGSDRSGSSSRWPKEEIEALIKLRTRMEEKYQQEGGAKGPLWEEISVEMKRIGYINRNAKRCKEKWENINKYFRKVKESNKKPRVDSKTCPYYYQLESLYANKSTAISPAAFTAEPPDDEDQDEDEDYMKREDMRLLVRDK